MVSLLHRYLGGAPELPPALRGALAERAAANARAALAAAGELRRLLDALAGAGVRAAAYKGPALAVRAYGDLALRSYGDLDLLVSPADLPPTAEVLRSAGYLPRYDLPAHAERLFRRVDGDYPFAHHGHGGIVEVHTRVSSLRFGAGLETDALLARAAPVPVGGGSVAAPADDDLFLALVLHGAKHRWARLEWLAAAAALALRGRLDLATLEERARAIGARRALHLALRLAGGLGLPLPPPAAEDPGVAAMADECRALWFADAPPEDATAANLAFNLRLQDGLRARAAFAARWLLLPTPEDWAWVSLPAPLAPLYGLLRPLRLALRYRPGGRR